MFKCPCCTVSYLRFFHPGTVKRCEGSLTALITSCHSRQTWHTGPTHLLSFFNGNKECWLLFGTFTKWLGRTSCNIQVPDPAGAGAGSGLAQCCHLPPRHRHPLVDNMWVIHLIIRPYPPTDMYAMFHGVLN